MKVVAFKLQKDGNGPLVLTDDGAIHEYILLGQGWKEIYPPIPSVVDRYQAMIDELRSLGYHVSRPV